MEIFAKTFEGWGATLTMDSTSTGKFGWKILIEDRRSMPPIASCITSSAEFRSAREAIVDGHGALEALMPEKVS